jgi:hypothetical protein
MCIFVTSGGNTAAPGPNLTASNCGTGQLKVPSWMVLCWGMSTFCGIVVSRGIGFIVRRGFLTALSFRIRLITLTILNVIWGMEKSFDASEVVHLAMHNYLSFRAKRPPVGKFSNLNGDLATTSRFPARKGNHV